MPGLPRIPVEELWVKLKTQPRFGPKPWFYFGPSWSEIRVQLKQFSNQAVPSSAYNRFAPVN